MLGTAIGDVDTKRVSAADKGDTITFYQEIFRRHEKSLKDSRRPEREKPRRSEERIGVGSLPDNGLRAVRQFSAIGERWGSSRAMQETLDDAERRIIRRRRR